MPVSNEQLLATLAQGGAAAQLLPHPADPQAAGTLTSVFVKDKKARFYVISALATTKIDLKLLSARLGLGKGGMKPAEPESVVEVLQVAADSVSPFAVANASASGVVLLFDHTALEQPAVAVASLEPGSCVSAAPAALQAALKVLGKDAHFVDLTAEPKIDRENPPDLAKYVPEPPAKPADADGTSKESQAPAAQPSKPAAAPAAAGGGGGGIKSASKQTGGNAGKPDAAAAEAAQLRQLADVDARTEEVLERVSQSLLGCGLGDSPVAKDTYALTRLRADVAMALTSLKNAAYTSGYTAGKGAVVAYAERRFA